MVENEMILGLVDSSSAIGCPQLAAKCRDLTITWSRYSYHGQIIEDASIDKIIDVAVSRGAHYCLILAYGQILQEQWLPEVGNLVEIPLVTEVRRPDQFLVAGRILKNISGWYGIDYRCFLVNLKLYSEFGRPSFEAAPTGTVSLPSATPSFKGNGIDKLEPASGSVEGRPILPGWQFIAESLQRGIAVVSIDQTLNMRVLNLSPENTQSARLLSGYLEEGIDQYDQESPHPGLTRDQSMFLGSVSAQTQNAKRGVFLINIEPYTDIDHPPVAPWGPISTLYSVAAGFKPNRILQTHGFDQNTRIVFFDYSPNALEIKKTMLAEWDGRDFPGFVKYLFELFPHPETFYQLWSGETPGEVDWSEFARFWHRELERFGGEREFRRHWDAYRNLRHEFIRADIFRSPKALIERIVSEPNAVMWFSNAPFTMYSNWHHTLEQRKQFYDAFIRQLAARNPHMLLYGADYTNTSVNCILASKYWDRYRDSKHDALNPIALNRYQIRS